jgi:tetratricopeptide (TPR) repeat protein
MFGLFNKEKFTCLGVNPDADWSNMDSIITPLNLQEYLKPKVYLKDEIKEIQRKFNQKEIPYKDILNEFNWISEKQVVNFKTISLSIITVISGVRQEFETSEPHNEIYKKYIAPSIIKSLSLGFANIKYDIEDVKNDYLDKGVIVPLHFDRVSVIESTIRDEKTGKIFRNLEIKEKLEPHSLEPNSYQKVDIIIGKMFEKIENDNTNIVDDEKELLKVLTDSEKLKGRYAELNCYYYLGIANIKIGLIDNAEKYFDILVNLQSDISKMTIAKDFLRPIGEFYEENDNLSKALFWYKKAIELSPAIGLKKKIAEIEKNEK